MSTNLLKMRRTIMRMEPGDVQNLSTGDADLQDFKRDVRAFARAKRIFVTIKEGAGELIITRVATKPRDNYPELDGLKVGESVLLHHRPEAHPLIRVAASVRGRDEGARYRCSREGDAMRVTRLPIDDDPEALARIAAAQPAARSKYGFDRLAAERSILLDLPRTEHHKARTSATVYAQRMAWTLSCNVEGDGLRVTRKDDNAPAGPVVAPVIRQARASKYAFERLQHQASILFDRLGPGDAQRIRMSAAVYAHRQGWKVSCHIEADGIRVTRTDAGAPTTTA